MKFLVNLVIVLLVNHLIAQNIIDTSNAIICEDDSIISLADEGGIELRNYDIVIIRFNF